MIEDVLIINILSVAIVLSLCILLMSYLLWSKAKKILIIHLDKIKVLVIAPTQQAQVQLLFDSCLKALKHQHNLFKMLLLQQHAEEHYRQQRLTYQVQDASCAEEAHLDACSLSTQDQISVYQANPQSLYFQSTSSCLVQAVFEDSELENMEIILEFIQDLPPLESADFELALSSYFETLNTPLYVICSIDSPNLVDKLELIERNALSIQSKLNACIDSHSDPHGHQSLLILGHSTELNETIFSSLKKHIVANRQKRARGKKLISLAKASFLVSIFLFVMSLFFLNAHLKLSRLPNFTQVDQWSVDSLIHTEQALLKVRKDSSSFRPDQLVLKLARPSLEKQTKEFDLVIINYLEQYIKDQLKTFEPLPINPQSTHPKPEALTSHNLDEEARFLSLIQRVIDREKSHIDNTATNAQVKHGVTGLKWKTKNNEDLQLLRNIYHHLQQSLRFSLLITHSDQLEHIYSTIEKLESYKQQSTEKGPLQNTNSKPMTFELKGILIRLIEQAYLKALNHSQSQSFVGSMNWRNFACQQQSLFSQSSPKSSPLSQQVFSHLEQVYQQQLLMLWQSTFPTDQKQTQPALQFNTTGLSALLFEVVHTLKSLKMIKEVFTKSNLDEDCLLKPWPLNLQQKWQIKLENEADKLKKLLIKSLKSSKSTDHVLKESLYKESQQLFTWALEHFENRESLGLMIELYQEQWINEINLALQASSALSVTQVIERIAKQLKSIEVKHIKQAKRVTKADSKSSQINLFINYWQGYTQKMTQWLKPHQILMKYDEIQCLEIALNSHGESKWNLLLGDKLEFYVTFDFEQQSFLSNEASNTLKFWWKPWSTIHIRIFEQDGEIDRLSTENNDHQIGLTRKVVWSTLPKMDQDKRINPKHAPKALLTTKLKTQILNLSGQDTQQQPFKLFLNDQHSCWTQVTFHEL